MRAARVLARSARSRVDNLQVMYHMTNFSIDTKYSFQYKAPCLSQHVYFCVHFLCILAILDLIAVQSWVVLIKTHLLQESR